MQTTAVKVILTVSMQSQKAELDKYSAETVNLQVDNSDIIVNGTANVFVKFRSKEQ
mgnify:CR=1 FL=1